MPQRVIPAVFLSLLLSLSTTARAQDAHLQLIDESVGQAIEQLQLRGYLLELNPTDLPYSDGDLSEALLKIDQTNLRERDLYWIELIGHNVSVAAANDSQAIVGIHFKSGVRSSNNGRLDQTRYLHDSNGIIWPNLLAQPRLTIGHFAAALGARLDLQYDQDPDGIDTALRIFTRAEDAYLRYQNNWFSATMGRFQRHWGVYGLESTILSDNPRSYDQIGFTLGGGRLRLRSVLGELDSITSDGRFTGTAGADSSATGNERRYLAAHRLDWRPNKNITVTAFQSVLYSGPNSGISLKYLNPLLPTIVALDNTPKNDENNGLLGFSLWYRHRKTVLFLQTLIDDFDVNSLKEPASLGFVGTVSFTDLIEGTTLKGGGTLIGSRTYNTNQTEGEYIYLLRGLATQFNDYISLYSAIDIFAFDILHGLSVTPRLDLLWQGEQDIRAPFPDSDGPASVLSGTVERTIRPALQFRYEPTPFVFIIGNFGVNAIRNAGHIPGKTKTKALGVLEIGMKLSFEQVYGLAF